MAQNHCGRMRRDNRFAAVVIKLYDAYPAAESYDRGRGTARLGGQENLQLAV